MRGVRGESAKEAATRAWLMLPLATRRKLAEKPGSTSPCEKVTKHLWQHLLRQTVLEARKDLAPVVTTAGTGALTTEHATAVVDAILSQAGRLDTVGDWYRGLRTAHQRLLPTPPRGLHFSSLGYRIYPLAWEASGRHGGRVDPAVCDSIMAAVLHGDPDTPPPTPAALNALCLSPSAVAQLQAIIDEAWAAPSSPTPAPSAPDLVQALLDQPENSSEWDKLWDGYAKSRPWQAYAGHLDDLGLSLHADPSEPVPVEADWRAKKSSAAAAEDERTLDGVLPAVLPLDRSLRERLHQPLGQLRDTPGVSHKSTRQIACEEAVRACHPLGVQDDTLRAVLCLAPVLATAFVPDTASKWYRKTQGNVVPRRLQQLSYQAWRNSFVRETYRLGDGQHAPVRAALEDPVRGFGVALWGVLHRQEIAGRRVEPENLWNTLVMGAAWSFLGKLAVIIRGVLDDPSKHQGTRSDNGDDPASLADHAQLATDMTAPGVDEPAATIADVLRHGLEQQGLQGRSALLYLERLADPLHHDWAAGTWQSLHDAYCEHYGMTPAPSRIPLDRARRFLVRFRTLHSPGGAR